MTALRRVTGDFTAWWVDGEPQPGEWMIHDSVVSKARPACRPEPGEATITIRYFCVALPNGLRCALPLRPVPQADQPINGGHHWDWDGNEDAPTLTPSLSAGRRGWHGWIRAGHMVSC